MGDSGSGLAISAACSLPGQQGQSPPKATTVKCGGICTTFQWHPSVLSCTAAKAVIAEVPLVPGSLVTQVSSLGPAANQGLKPTGIFVCVCECVL